MSSLYIPKPPSDVVFDRVFAATLRMEREESEYYAQENDLCSHRLYESDYSFVDHLLWILHEYHCCMKGSSVKAQQHALFIRGVLLHHRLCAE